MQQSGEVSRESSQIRISRPIHAWQGLDHWNDGEIRGAERVRDKFGTALHFGGREAYVTIPGLTSVDASPELTAEAWVYWEQGGRYPNILTGGTWCPGGFLFFVADNGCSFRLGKPGKGPLQVGKDGAETSASFGVHRELPSCARFRILKTGEDNLLVGRFPATLINTQDRSVRGDSQIGVGRGPGVEQLASRPRPAPVGAQAHSQPQAFRVGGVGGEQAGLTATRQTQQGAWHCGSTNRPAPPPASAIPWGPERTRTACPPRARIAAAARIASRAYGHR